MSTGIAFKVTLKRRDRDEIRRFVGTYTFNEFLSVIAHVWGSAPKGLQIGYYDDDNDFVILTSEPEWNECLRIYGECVVRNTGRSSQPLRIFVARTDSHCSRLPERVPSTSAPQEPTLMEHTSQTIAPTKCIEAPKVILAIEAPHVSDDSVVARLMAAANEATSPIQSTPTAPREQVAPMEDPKPASCNAEAPREHTGVIQLLSLLFNCDAIRELATNGDARFDNVVRLHADAKDASNVHLDVDRQRLHEAVIEAANSAMESNLHSIAAWLLTTAIEFFPQCPIMEYNLSCAFALDRQPHLAVRHLERSIECGYRNFNHIRADPDLSSIRNRADYLALLEKHCPKAIMPSPTIASIQPSFVEPETTTTTPNVPALEATVTPQRAEYRAEEIQNLPASLPAHVVTLMSVFPQLSADMAQTVLNRTNNNIHFAVNYLLTTTA